MRLGDPLDPALQAASLALNGRARQASSRFASIELRTKNARFTELAPIGYTATIVIAVATVVTLWTL